MKIVRTVLLSGIVVVAAAACVNLAFTAGNTVAASKVGSARTEIEAADLQPAVCAANGVDPEEIVSGTANPLNGTDEDDLIIGTRNDTQTLSGRGGRDCIVAGAVPSGKTIVMLPETDSGSVCVKGPGPGSYVYGSGCAVKA